MSDPTQTIHGTGVDVPAAVPVRPDPYPEPTFAAPPQQYPAEARYVPQPPPTQQVIVQQYGSHPLVKPKAFEFDGGAGDALGVTILAVLLTIFTLGFCYPWAMVMRYRWQCEHTIIEGRRLRFTGRGSELFGNWIIWGLLMLVTAGIYGLWVVPKLTKWQVEHQEYGQ